MQTIEIAAFKLPQRAPDEFPLHQGLRNFLNTVRHLYFHYYCEF